MSVRSRPLAVGLVAPVQPATVSFTVPAGRTAIIRTSVLFNGLAAVNVLSVSAVTSVGNQTLYIEQLGTLEVKRFGDWYALGPGDSMRVQGTVAGGQLALFGALLLGAWS